MFEHGVASGDPAGDAVVLWTRVSPSNGQPVQVEWELALDPGFEKIVDSGSITTDAGCDHTVRVAAHGLTPGIEHYYRFSVGDEISRVGRTRTWAPGSPSLRIGVTCCAHYQGGYFNVYRALADRDDLDFVLHLGDYIYELEDDHVGFSPWNLVAERKQHPSTELFTLGDYRARHAQFKQDPDLQDLHARHPMIHLWDDHEVVNDAWADGCPGADEMPVSWAERKAAGVRAFWEWLPLRWPDTGTSEAFGDLESTAHPRLYRSFSFGDLASLFAIDTRHEGRDLVPEPLTAETYDDARRRMMSDDQFNWLVDGLEKADTAWRLIANPSMMNRLAVHDMPEDLIAQVRKIGKDLGDGSSGNPGQWEGYAAHRQEFVDFLRREGRHDLVVLTGDIHSSWAAELQMPDGEPAIGVEFVTPSVTTRTINDLIVDGAEDAAKLREIVIEQHPWVRFVDLEHHGYLVVDVNRERVAATWFHVDTVRSRQFVQSPAASWDVPRGSSQLRPSEPLVPAPDP